MFFKVGGHMLTLAQMLWLLDENQLGPVGIRQFSASKAKAADAG
jgi:hypothetical protein